MITFEIDHIDFSSINCCSNLHRRNKKESEKQRERERNKVKENGEAFLKRERSDSYSMKNRRKTKRVTFRSEREAFFLPVRSGC